MNRSSRSCSTNRRSRDELPDPELLEPELSDPELPDFEDAASALAGAFSAGLSADFSPEPELSDAGAPLRSERLSVR